MRKVVTLTGKNLPRLAVAKPGWPAGACDVCGAAKGYFILSGGGEVFACTRCPLQSSRQAVVDQTGLSENLRK